MSNRYECQVPVIYYLHTKRTSGSAKKANRAADTHYFLGDRGKQSPPLRPGWYLERSKANLLQHHHSHTPAPPQAAPAHSSKGPHVSVVNVIGQYILDWEPPSFSQIPHRGQSPQGHVRPAGVQYAQYPSRIATAPFSLGLCRQCKGLDPLPGTGLLLPQVGFSFLRASLLACLPALRTSLPAVVIPILGSPLSPGWVPPSFYLESFLRSPGYVCPGAVLPCT